FPGTPSPVSGIGLAELAAQALAAHREAYGPESPHKLTDLGLFRYRVGGEYHAFNPNVFKGIQKVGKSGEAEDFQALAEQVESRPPVALRDRLRFRHHHVPVPLSEVEDAMAIARRFTGAAMSMGALSKEAHECVAIALNRIGARSNSGEGGESEERYHPRANGDSANSAIKQIASGRFGVTPAYLVSASELEIKMAQGSKPGEGGQLPGKKVNEEIALLRRATPGTTLISPPPHHDIYSIEDLAQLIYDLKRVNPQAPVAVKLVSESGVGTIAAGVAKAHADRIHISGHDGGTGASPLGSIKHAGAPWELGLAEVQQVLIMNNLRDRVALRVDGGLKSGRDVMIAALLGAEEFGFGTTLLVAAGCVMIRQCHANTCPVGIATQDPKLRARFKGTPENIVNYLLGVAEDVRQRLAELGFRTLDEAIGRVDMLELAEALPGRAAGLDLSALIADPDPSRQVARRRHQAVSTPPAGGLDDAILDAAKEAIEGHGEYSQSLAIRNVDRTVGGRLAGAIAERHGDHGFKGRLRLSFTGSAGQSFGAFCLDGLELHLTGDANDYVGKGMAGGLITMRPPEGARYAAHESVILGNTVMYGATGGRLFAAGRAGERFCVRNSGGTAVVEGLGDHGCEYMTGGVVVVLGPTGRNFAAGMTGGVAYVLDESDRFTHMCNRESVLLEAFEGPEDALELRRLVEAHAEMTGSAKARALLADWEQSLSRFWRVQPKASEALPVPVAAEAP
ncbi:MAG: glutamate synthase-related protein, partial [Candidatus Sericytochromatia bacterium]